MEQARSHAPTRAAYFDEFQPVSKGFNRRQRTRQLRPEAIP
jgi:hypothetical protein